MYNVTPGTCNTPLAAWIVFGVVLCIGKAFVVYKHVTVWIERSRKMKRAIDRRMIPFVPVLGILSFLVYTVFFFLTGFNIINSSNGWAGGIYSFGWFAFGAMSIFYFLKMLRLGKRLIPLSKKVLSNPNAMEIKDDDLGKFDTVGRILFIIECLSVFGQTFLLAVIGVAVSHSPAIALASFGVMALFLFVHTMSVLWLVERTIVAIKKSQFKPQNNNNNNNSGGAEGDSSSTRRSDISAIIRKMREQQTVIFVLALTGSLVYVLIVTTAIPPAWYVVLIHMYYDLVANLVIVFSMSRRRRRQNKGHDFQTPKILIKNMLLGDATTTAPTPPEANRKSNRLQASIADMTAQAYNNPGSTAAEQQPQEEPEPRSYIMVFQSNAGEAEVQEDDQ